MRRKRAEFVPVQRWPERDHAESLHAALLAAFTGSGWTPELSVSGEGVHWQCDARQGGRAVSVHCLDHLGSPQHLTVFREMSRDVAYGRTRSREDTVAATLAWLGQADLSVVYDRFAFVDHDLRQLSRLADHTARVVPALPSHDIRSLGSDLFELWYIAGDRSCRVSYYGENPHPDAVFHWDECQQFQFVADDPDRLAAVLGRWL